MRVADSDTLALEARLREGLDGLPPGQWEVYDGCSWRRIGTTGRGYDDCGVLYPCNASDGHPDLSSRQGDRDAVLEHFALCSGDNIRQLLDALATLRQRLEQVEKERDAARTALVTAVKQREEANAYGDEEHTRAERSDALLAEAGKVLVATRRDITGGFSTVPTVFRIDSIATKIAEARDAR